MKREFDILILIKLSIAFIAGMMFWFFVSLILMAYAFMPISKESHSTIFTIAAPLLYLLGTTFLFNKLFKTEGWKAGLGHFGLIAAGAGVALLVMDGLSRVLG